MSCHLLGQAIEVFGLRLELVRTDEHFDAPIQVDVVDNTKLTIRSFREFKIAVEKTSKDEVIFSAKAANDRRPPQHRWQIRRTPFGPALSSDVCSPTIAAMANKPVVNGSYGHGKHSSDRRPFREEGGWDRSGRPSQGHGRNVFGNSGRR
jgi:hypothetical protein